MRRLCPIALLVAGVLLPAGCRPRYVPPPALPGSATRSPPHAVHSAVAAPAPPADRDADPPAEAPLGDASTPRIASRTLPNGLGLGVITRRKLPLVSLRLVVRAGRASDGARPGVAELTARLLAASGAGRWNRRQLARRIESLGGSLQVHVDPDATWLGLDVGLDQLDRALELLSAIAMQPRFLPATFHSIRQRAQDAATANAATDPHGVIRQALVRRLFELRVGVDPYAHGAASAGEIGRLSLDDCRGWQRAHFVPAEATLIVAGDVKADDVERATQSAFAHWKGSAPAEPEPTAALAPDRVEIDVIDRPGALRSDIAIATLGPDPDSPHRAALLGAVELLGGGSGRLARGLRDRKHLIQGIDAQVDALAHGPALIVFSAQSRTEHTAEAVEGILDAMGSLGSALPTDDEVDVAMRALVEHRARQLETVRGLARMGRRLAELGLPDDGDRKLDDALRGLDPHAVNAAAQLFLRRGHVRIVVGGDAKRVAAALAHFGPVHLVNPAHDFTVIRSLPADPSAPLVIAPVKARTK